jgi:hypothetical protein
MVCENSSWVDMKSQEEVEGWWDGLSLTLSRCPQSPWELHYTHILHLCFRLFTFSYLW